jgi:hypothetical protein
LQRIQAGRRIPAVEAVRQYRFKPGAYQAKPVPVAITIEVSFHIYPGK